MGELNIDYILIYTGPFYLVLHLHQGKKYKYSNLLLYHVT